ncbi:aspartate phosphatase [Bacillus sonorensis]|uniref:response regulator aspartate phosphatase n=1 Tax=Bacillus sonorensis TaxID=119858 RepID=UPI002DBDDA0E|nr:tetratricopeptide repeat protein [Bacillus sonorensis]MEC1500948.1 aspartate phosphatase [Bacillus sonorensis]
MAAKIAFEAVGNSLNQWYGLIRQNNITEAAAMREEIKRTLDAMEENQDVLLYFNLIDSRFKLLTERYEESGTLLKNINKTPEEIGTDNMIQYYFYFFSGMYEFYKKDFITAINFYKIAEHSLYKIPDEIEIAEFHYHLAIAYYEIRQNIFSLNHAEKALESFQAHDEYTSKTLKSKMVIAANYVDLQRFHEAEELYRKVYGEASGAGDFRSAGLACMNLGICYERHDQLLEARQCFEKALNIPEHRQSVFSLRSKYMLSRVLYKMGLYAEARHWYQKAASLASKKEQTEFQSKLFIIHSLYEKCDPDGIDQGLKHLERQQHWSDVADLAINCAKYFKQENNYVHSAKYFEKACYAKDQIFKLTEAVS